MTFLHGRPALLHADECTAPFAAFIFVLPEEYLPLLNVVVVLVYAHVFWIKLLSYCCAGKPRLTRRRGVVHCPEC